MSKNKYLINISVLLLLVLFLTAGAGLGIGQARSNQNPRIVGGFGVVQVQGANVIVHVLVEVPSNQTAREAINRALTSYGARPFSPAYQNSGDFEIIGQWQNPAATQNYNSISQPLSNGREILERTHATWTQVEGSNFVLSYGGQTFRCPSLVRECIGPQKLDGHNDFAWLSLQGGVLGVSWISSRGGYIAEVDIALSTRYNWADNGVNHYDAETVMLHENGHLIGLGHSQNPAAVMYAYYNGVKRELHPADIAGIIYLYGDGGETPPPDDGGDKCPPGWQKQGKC